MIADKHFYMKYSALSSFIHFRKKKLLLKQVEVIKLSRSVVVSLVGACPTRNVIYELIS